MAKITRVFQKLFGQNGNPSNFGKFGSAVDTPKVFTKDPATIQGLDAFTGEGLADSVLDNRRVELEDLNSLFLLAFYQLAYLMQAGIPEWDASTTYYTGSFCQVSGVIYRSLIDDNINYAPASNPTRWIIFGGWQEYTPVLTNITIGNGSVSGRYAKIGRTVHYYIRLVFGSTTALTGQPAISAPIAPYSVTGAQLGTANYNDQFLGAHSDNYTLAAYAPVVANDNAIAAFPVSSVFPFSWTTGYTITIRGSYESVS